MPDGPITLHRSGPVASLVLSAPPKNEMGAAFFAELSRLAPELARLPEKGLVVRGEGRHFSSGANLNELRTMLGRSSGRDGMRSLLDNSGSFSAIASLRFPTVAAIRGCCLGSGLELALACRYRIAERNAVLGLPEATFGLMPGCGGTVRLTRLVGYGKAMEMILTGASMLASDALASGLVDAVVAKEELDEMAMKFIERLG
jgi:enoyl-CoA hydratase/carnithine racemase